jgi:hypothetical protein
MTLPDLRGFVRDHLDLDPTELPDSLLDRFIADGFNRIDNYSRVWTFRAVEYTLSTVAGAQAYNVANRATPPRVDSIAKPLQQVVDVRGPRFGLVPRDHRQMRSAFRTTNAQQSEPRYFTMFGENVYLWPTPNAVYALTVTGYRLPDDWMASSLAPDLPEEFHELVGWWALNRAYGHQDDPEMANFYRQEFDTEVKSRARRYVTGNQSQPMRLNEGIGEDELLVRNGLGPLFYPWD